MANMQNNYVDALQEVLLHLSGLDGLVNSMNVRRELSRSHAHMPVAMFIGDVRVTVEGGKLLELLRKLDRALNLNARLLEIQNGKTANLDK
jgi:hypothetical protein